MTWHQYAAAWAEHNGGYDLRRAPASVRAWLRTAYAVACGLASLKVPLGVLFGLGLGLALAAPVAARSGGMGLLAAAVVVVLSAFTHTVDGALALLTASDPARAAIRAALAGRLGEFSWLVTMWLVGVPGPAVAACGAITVLHESARREALVGGMTPAGVQTVGDRPMRVWVSAVGLFLAGLAGLLGVPIEGGLLAVALTIWLLLAVIGAGQLTTAVRRTLP